MFSHTLSASEVPLEFQDIGILHGYRHPNTSFRGCLLSLFSWHNETLNVWTHIVSLGFFIYFTVERSQHVDFRKQENEALLCLLLSCMAFSFGSAVAHLFNCMSNNIRNICFMVDYLAISIYAYSACLVNKVYALPASWTGGLLEEWFLTGMSVICVLTVALTCHTRFMPRTILTKVLRLGAFLLPYSLGMSPCLFRVLFCLADNSCDAATYYKQHFVTNIFTILFYAGHIPELFFPGYFDIFFQSHSIFHVVVVLATFRHAQGILLDSVLRPTSSFSLLPVSPLLTQGVFTLTSCVIVIYFSIKFCRLKNANIKHKVR